MPGEDVGEGGEELKMEVIEDYFGLVWLKMIGEGQREISFYLNNIYTPFSFLVKM